MSLEIQSSTLQNTSSKAMTTPLLVLLMIKIVMRLRSMWMHATLDQLKSVGICLSSPYMP